MKKIRKFMVYLLSIFILMGSYTPVQAVPIPTEYVTDEGLEYAIDSNNEIVITGYSGSSTTLVIPDIIAGNTVTSIGNEAFFENKQIEIVQFPETLKKIGRMAFLGCDKLEMIEFPKNLEWIGVCAFQMCYSLKKVIIYENTELEDGDIGNRVFSSYATGFIMYGYKDSPAEAYAKKWKDSFVFNDWIPLTNITLPEQITVNLNEKTEIPILYGPENSYVGFRTIDERSFTGPAMAQFEYGENGTLYITGTKVGQNELYITKNKVYNYIDDYIVSNVCKVNVIDLSIINAESIIIKDSNNNEINNKSLYYDTYETGESYPISLETLPADANEDVVFTSNNGSYAKVNHVNGAYELVLGSGYLKQAQTCTITATGQRSGVTASFEVTVFYSGADSVFFDSGFINNKDGKTNKIVDHSEYSMPLKVVPSNLTDDTVITISNEDVIHYDKNTSTLRAVGVGSSTITAECKGRSISYDFEVIPYENKATSVTINTNEKLIKTDSGYTMAMDLNETYKVNATVLPINTTDIFKWSTFVNNGVISIDNQGNITAIKAGTAKIKASSCSYLEEIVVNAQSDYLTITVTDPNAVEEPEPITEIKTQTFKFNGVSAEIKKGSTLQLIGVIVPADTTDILTYSSNAIDVATVSSTGLVTAVGEGTAWITGKINGKISYFIVTVEEEITPPTLTLSQTSLSMKKGESKQLNVYVGENTSSPQWSTNNSSIISITSNGLVTAKSAGTALVTVTAYNQDNSQSTTASCFVTVKEDVAPPTDNGNTDNGNSGGNNGGSEPTEEQRKSGVIKLNATKFNLQKGKTTKALTIKSSTYSDDPIVSVTSSNKKILKASFKGNTISLKGVKTSSKYVTVKVTTKSGATATCKIKVVKSKVSTSKLKLNKKSITLKKGKSATLVVTQTPISATDKLKWISSNKKIAVVNKNGKIVAKKKGSCIITLKSSNGKKVTCKVKVN